MGWNFWEDYAERNGPCTCCPGNEEVKLTPRKTPTVCKGCKETLSPKDHLSNWECNGCYLTSSKGVVISSST